MGTFATPAGGRGREQKGVAAVEKIKESESPPIFSGTATGHNGADSKSCGDLSVSSTKNLVTVRVLPGSKIE